MADHAASLYPLQDVTESNLKQLCLALWNWHLCDFCRDSRPCSGAPCAWENSVNLKMFFEFYEDLTSSYVPDLLPGCSPALRNHGDICEIIGWIRARPEVARSELTETYFATRRKDGSKAPHIDDQRRAFNLAVKVMSMITCSAGDRSSSLLEMGIQPLPWHNKSSFGNFVKSVLPKSNFAHDVAKDDVQRAISARTLRKTAGLKFRGTDDIRNHLQFDAQDGVVEVYHYTSVLKEHLQAGKIQSASSMDNVPRQVALEILHSIYIILFPINTPSENILRYLVASESFDPDCLVYDFSEYRDLDEEDIEYHHFGSRLMDLYEQVQNPSPRGFWRWLERKSKDHYVMMVTILAFLLGLLSLAVGVFQAVIAYEAWINPRDPP